MCTGWHQRWHQHLATRAQGLPHHPRATNPSFGRLQAIQRESDEADLRYLAWLRQVRQDKSGMLLARLVDTRDYSDAYWLASLRGMIARREAHRILHPQHGANNVPLPNVESAFRSQTIVTAAAEWLGLRILEAKSKLSARVDQRISQASVADPGYTSVALAWLMINPLERAPKIYVRAVPEDMLHHAVFDAACVVGMFDLLHAFFTRPVPGDIKPLPDRQSDPIFTPMLHRYAKSRLYLKDECHPTFGCACNTVAQLVNARPSQHAAPTGTLSVEMLKKHIELDRLRYPTRPIWSDDDHLHFDHPPHPNVSAS